MEPEEAENLLLRVYKHTGVNFEPKKDDFKHIKTKLKRL